MALKIIFALVSAAALCCAQTEAPSAPSSAGIPAKEAPAPSVPAPASPPETNQNPTGQNPTGPIATPQNAAAPAVQPATPAPNDQPPPSGKAEALGRFAGAKPDSGKKAYVIGKLDVLTIKVWNNPNLSGLVPVDSDGLISMSLIGEIKADGLTTKQLKEKLVERLRDFFNNNPDVDITVTKVNSKRYFVYGGVGRAGEYPLVQETTVMDALSSVGGFAPFGNKKKIRVQRMLPSGAVQEFKFNYDEVSKGKNMQQNIVIENGDRIFVPE
jgi:polysaccharide biosynthesis/export protein